jgi:hypothetical protein
MSVKMLVLFQKEICSKLRISQAAYCKWEKRKSVNGKRLEKFLIAINCSKEELEYLKKFLSPPQK